MKERNKAIYSMIFQLSNSDEFLSVKEVKYLMHIADALTLSIEEIEEIESQPHLFELKPPHSEQERMTILYYMLFSSQIDGVIHMEEEKHLYKAGLKLGFNEMLVKDMINLLKNHLTEVLPDEALISIIRQHLN